MTVKEIQEAIREDRICIYLQPIYDIKVQKFVSAELLARIIDKNGKLIYPVDFIPVAEQSKIMYSLELKILQKICELITSNEIQQLGLDYIEVNLSAKNTEKRSFLRKVKEIIDSYNIQHDHINIEITETFLPKDQTTFFENINKLKDENFQISLDDFGTGFNNLQYLLKIPVKLIKIDMSLVKEMFINNKSIPIAKGIIETAHAIGAKVVAEGVEDMKTYELLHDLDVDYIQGYYFSKPLHVQDFIQFINNARTKMGM